VPAPEPAAINQLGPKGWCAPVATNTAGESSRIPIDSRDRSCDREKNRDPAAETLRERARALLAVTAVKNQYPSKVYFGFGTDNSETSSFSNRNSPRN